jgi:hypothetical protein
LNPNEQPQEELDDLQKKVRAIPDQQWLWIQRIAGALLGILSGFLLTYFGNFDSTRMYSTIGAVLVALLVPNLTEKRIKRSVQKGRVAMIIALGAWLVIYAGIMLLSGRPLIANPA